MNLTRPPGEMCRSQSAAWRRLRALPVHCVSETEIALLRFRDDACSVFLQHESFAHQFRHGGLDLRDVARVAAVTFLKRRTRIGAAIGARFRERDDNNLSAARHVTLFNAVCLSVVSKM